MARLWRSQLQVNMAARHEYEFVENYKVLKRGLQVLGIVKVPPQKLLVGHSKGSVAGVALTWAVRSSWNGSGLFQRRSPTPS